MWQYNYTDELYHYGVPGMRWGHRKKYLTSDGKLNNLGNARKAYEEAKADRKAAKKDLSIRKSGFGIGPKGLIRKNKAFDEYNKAEANLTLAKAKYAAAKQKNENKAQKAENKSLVKSMYKSGLPGSRNDRGTLGRSTRIYDKIKAEKGKKYADDIVNRLHKRNVAVIVGSSAALAGSMAVQAILGRR